jgi:ribosome-binding factor A
MRRVNAALREVLAEAIARQLSDPRLGFITITEVQATRDMREAKVLYTTLQKDRRPSQDALESARGVLQGRVATELGSRQTPQLSFVYDDHQDRARSLTRLIDEVAPPRPPDAAPDVPAEGPGAAGGA